MEELVGKRKYIYEVTPCSFSTPLSVHGPRTNRCYSSLAFCFSLSFTPIPSPTHPRPCSCLKTNPWSSTGKTLLRMRLKTRPRQCTRIVSCSSRPVRHCQPRFVFRSEETFSICRASSLVSSPLFRMPDVDADAVFLFARPMVTPAIAVRSCSLSHSCFSWSLFTRRMSYVAIYLCSRSTCSIPVPISHCFLLLPFSASMLGLFYHSPRLHVALFLPLADFIVSLPFPPFLIRPRIVRRAVGH